MQTIALTKTAVLAISALFFVHYVAFGAPRASLSTRFSGPVGYGRFCAPLPQPENRLFGPPLPAERVDEHTSDFEAAAYRSYYPDTATLSDAQMRGHYVLFGRKEHRIHRRLRVVLNYAAPAGLANQYYSHVDMVALGLEAGAEVVLSVSWKRDGSFSDKYAEHPWPHGWTAVPLGTLHDVDELVRWAKDRQGIVHRTAPELGSNTVEVRMSGTAAGICCSKPMGELLYLMRYWVVTTAMQHMEQHPGKELPVVVVTITKETMMALRTDISHVQLASEVSRLIRPAAYLEGLADTIVSEMTTRRGERAFNGVHLRLEQDSPYVEMMGGLEAAWLAYFRSMQDNGFDAETPIYVASGLLTYLNSEDFKKQVVDRVVQQRLCSSIMYKEMILKKEQLEGLHTEALAMLDMLVLSRAARFTGFHASSFSWYVQEHRCQRGIPVTTTTMPKESELGSEAFLPNTLKLNNYTAVCPS